jgi:steroid 5-alpha reductase family enzyme
MSENAQSLTRALILVPLLSAGLLGVAWIASGGGLTLWGAPLLVICAAASLLVQWAAFVPAALGRNERFFDLIGSLTYLALIALSLGVASTQRALDPRQLVASAMVCLWAARLGSFLFRRVHRAGKDGRFDEIKVNPPRFLVVWTIQALWVFLTALAVLLINTSAAVEPGLTVTDVLGWALWGAGFAIEVAADRQKSAFNAKPENAGRWIDEGLWSRSRHPNYFGEITLWTGLCICGMGVFQGWQWLGLISPLFVALLLTRVSGIPLLDKRALEKWGDDPEYQAYRARTPRLIPRIR